MRTTEEQAELDLLREQNEGLQTQVKELDRRLSLAVQVAQEALRFLDDAQVAQMRHHLEGGDDGHSGGNGVCRSGSGSPAP